MKLKFLTTFFSLLITAVLYAQTGGASQNTSFVFENPVHDFGTVNEDGYIKHDFVFTNTGSAPLVITNVRASCGCTTPFWTTEPVMPGQKGVITAQYHTVNRPGVFNKTLTVTANTEPAMTLLTIKGNVLPKVKTPAEMYPTKIGTIRTFSDHVYLGKISTKEPIMKQVILYNEGTEPVTFSTHELPAYLEITFSPQTIGSNEKSIVKILYNGAKRNELGPVEDKVVIRTNEKEENKIVLNIQTDINEYYPPVPETERENVPKAVLDNNVIDMGTIKPNTIITKEITVTNTGKQDLELKKVRSGASYISVKPEKTIVKAGQSVKLKVTYKATSKTGPDNQYIWIHSNDPLKSTQSITIRANVVVE